MILTPTPVEIRFGRLDTKGSDKLLPAGTPDVAQNVVMTASGRYERRSGTALLTTVSSTRNLQDYKSELLIGTDTTLYSRYGAANNSRGVLTSFDTRHVPESTSAFEQVQHDMVISGGYEWHVWVDARGLTTNSVYYSVRDVTTGAYVVPATSITTGSTTVGQPRIFAVSGGNILITYVFPNISGNNEDLWGHKIAVASPSVVGSATVIEANIATVATNDIHASYDGVPDSSTEVVLACLIKNGGSATDERIKLIRWNVSTMASVTTLTESADRNSGEGGVAIIHQSSGYWVAHTGGDTSNTVRLLIAASNLASFTTTATLKSYGAPVTLKAVTGWVDGSSTAHLLVERIVTSGATTRPQVEYYTRTTGGSVTEVGTTFGFSLASSAFTHSGSKYVCVTAPLPGDVTATATMFIAAADKLVPGTVSGDLVGRVLPRRAAVDSALKGTGKMLPAVQTTSSGFAVAADYLVTTTRIGAATVYFEPSVRTKWVESADVTVIPGSWPRIYDGLSVTELGFEGPPFIANTAVSGSGAMADGLYYYRCCWMWVDATSREHRSVPSPAKAVTVSGGANDRRVTLTVESLTATLKKAPNPGALLEVYRSPVNPSAGSEADYFLAKTSANTTSAVTFDVIDDIADSTLLTQQRLYTLGDGVLPNTESSPCTAVETFGNRVYSIDGHFIVFSKLLEEARGISHNADQYLEVNDRFGSFVGLADGGSRLLAFKRGAIYAVTGQGPDNTGGGDFPVVDRLDLPLGARSHVSIVSTEVGTFFQDDSTGQIWLLGEGPEYIGAPVEALMTGLTIVDAIQVGRQVRFHTSSLTFVYDTYFKQWTWFTNQGAACAGVINGVAHYATAAGSIRYDDSTSWTESGTTYQAAVELTWLSLAGLSGYQRIYKIITLGESLGAHTLSVISTYKFGSQTATKTVASSSLSGVHGYRIVTPVKLAHQQSTSIKIRLEDNSPTTAGWGLEALVLEVGVESRTARLPVANRTA